jgi:methylenetetrahydrofolate reductase (NADPH)
MNLFERLYGGDSKSPVFSLEVIPPIKKEDIDESRRKIEALILASNPAYVSVTRRAEGSDDNTLLLCKLIQMDLGIKAIPHITAANHNKETLRILEDRLIEADLDHILVVRGDKSGLVENAFNSSIEVLKFISSHFHVAVTAIPEGYPHEGMNISSSNRHFRDKIKAGAKLALSQLFLDDSVWSNFVSQHTDVEVPIIPGVMPLTSKARLARMVELTGLSVPQEVKSMMNMDESGFRNKGIEFTASLIRRLFKMGAKGIHLFSFNSEKNTCELKDLIKELN